MADINDVARDISIIKQKLEEIDRRLIQLSADVKKITSRFGDAEISKDKSILDMI